MNLISEQPWYYFLLCFLAGFGYAFLLYQREIKRDTFTKLLIYVLFSFRFITVTVISFLLLNVFLKHTTNETEKPVIIFAQDNSTSVISSKDSTPIRTDLLKRINELNVKLAEKYTVNYLLFGTKTRAESAPDFSDKETDFSQLLNEVENNYANQNIGALVIASDGIINKGANPLYIAEKFKFPVYTIALGDTTLKKDVLIQKINHNQVVYLENKFPVEVVLQSLKLKGKPVTVSIWQGATKKGEQTVTVTNDNFIQTLNFILEADKPGVQKYNVQITPLAEENNTQNNTQSFVIDVIDNREKIMILAKAPHPDIAAIKESIEANQAYEVESYILSDLNKPLKPYSLIILHNVALANSNLLKEMNANGQSYLMIDPMANDIIPGVKINSSYNKFNETEPVINKNFSLFNVSDELKNFVKDLPAVNCYFGNYNVSAGANSLLFQKIGVVDTENPMLVFSDNSGQKTGAFIGDGIWKWKLRDYADHKNHNLFNELLNKTIQYLSVKADKSFFRVYTKKIINENEVIDFNAEVYNQSYQLITEPEVNVTLFDEAGKQYNYTLSKNGNGYHIEAGLFPPGEYKYKANTKVNGLLLSQSGIITVKAVVAEKTNTIADHSLLYQLSRNSGGKLFYANEIEKLEKELLTNELIKPVTYSQKQLNDLIDLKWLFFLLLGLLSAEWFLRKRGGSI